MSMLPPASRRDMQRNRRASHRTYMIRRTVAVSVVLAVLVILVVAVTSVFGGSSKGKSAATTSTSSTTSTQPLNPITLAAVGDMDMGNTPDLAPNASTYFSNVIGALKAPIEFGNLE